MHPRFTPIATTLLLIAAVLLAVPSSAAATAPAPRIPRGLSAAIEPLGGYVAQVSCQPTIRPGTAKLARLLAYTYRNYNATSWASTYACGTDGTRSEHYDGRAIDWMVDVRNTRQHDAAKAAIAWFLATDKAGNRFAMARRLGVMYLIYNNRMWGAWDGKWEDYNNCSHLPQRAYDNSCHRTHMHISLTWNGAMARTSYWTKSVAPIDYGRCRVPDLNWAPRYNGRNLVPCPSYPMVRPKASASATKKALVNYSGAAVRGGWSGPAVTAVQRALGAATTGMFDAGTVAAVKRFQRRHTLLVTGAMNVPTWRALLAVTR
jgi:hypothetical protein